MFNYNGRVIHIDPNGEQADYAQLPRADMVCITHHHHDHLDPAALAKIRTDSTIILLTKLCAEKVKNGRIMKNGLLIREFGIEIEAVEAYNLVNKNPMGQPFHPKGVGIGYIFSFGTTRVYVAGDTENIPEMKSLKNISVAF
jgi:L-ascorbate metabolism protein UlaG (beta-lactamase superfamily)